MEIKMYFNLELNKHKRAATDLTRNVIHSSQIYRSYSECKSDEHCCTCVVFQSNFPHKAKSALHNYYLLNYEAFSVFAFWAYLKWFDSDDKKLKLQKKTFPRVITHCVPFPFTSIVTP